MSEIATVLFVCTGNIYRSRFAEALFNEQAERRGLPWRAVSRGLETWHADGIQLSEHTLGALRAMGIPLERTAPAPQQLLEEDIASADLIIGLCAREHIPMVHHHFPRWLDRFWFWDVEDLDRWPSTRALPEIERGVDALLDDLSRAAATGSPTDRGGAPMPRREAV